MSEKRDWKDAARSAQSLDELRTVLETRNPAFRKAADERRCAEAMVDHLRAALKRTRKRVHIRQAQLAATMGTTQSSVSAVENGSGDLGMVTLFKYLEGLNVDPATWLREHAHEIGNTGADSR